MESYWVPILSVYWAIQLGITHGKILSDQIWLPLDFLIGVRDLRRTVNQQFAYDARLDTEWTLRI